MYGISPRDSRSDITTLINISRIKAHKDYPRLFSLGQICVTSLKYTGVDMHKSQQMTREDWTISWNPNLSLGVLFNIFVRNLVITLFFQFLGVVSFREL